ncbi:MAG TPA: hypothetical protein VH253_09310 [Phycisphaerae bacterium]|nr:hypothetical protein [Phycisphaerae bacterium]
MSQDLMRRVAVGAAAGVAGTLVLQGTVMGMQRLAPQWDAPEAEDPASFMLWQGEKHLPRKVWMGIPAKAETAAGVGLSLAYGATFGALYAAARGHSRSRLLEGALLGTAVWAVGYLGWLPAAKLIPPVWRQELKQITGPVVQHLVYGVVTVAAYEYLRGKWSGN